MLILALISSCTLNQDQSISIEDIDFKTRDDTELFFKNIRQSSYDLEENHAASINIFRFKKRTTDCTSLEPNPSIIHHWLRDQAYIWIEIRGKSNFDHPLAIQIILPDGTKRNFQFDGSSPKNHLETAIELFNASLTEATITCEGSEILKPASSERANYLLVLNDYFRLLGLK